VSARSTLGGIRTVTATAQLGFGAGLAVEDLYVHARGRRAEVALHAPRLAIADGRVAAEDIAVVGIGDGVTSTSI
jgi:hypothetical protein